MDELGKDKRHKVLVRRSPELVPMEGYVLVYNFSGLRLRYRFILRGEYVAFMPVEGRRYCEWTCDIAEVYRLARTTVANRYKSMQRYQKEGRRHIRRMIEYMDMYGIAFWWYMELNEKADGWKDYRMSLKGLLRWVDVNDHSKGTMRAKLPEDPWMVIVDKWVLAGEVYLGRGARYKK